MIFRPYYPSVKLFLENAKSFVLCLFLIFAANYSDQALAASPAALSYQGRILKTDGTPLEYNNVSFIFQITNPNGSCVIYQEQVTGYSFVNSGGVFDAPIGEGSVQYPLGGAANILEAFDNSKVFNCGNCTLVNGVYTCVDGTNTYTASVGDFRKLRVSFYDGNGWKTVSPDNIIRSVPYAGYALSSQKLGSYIASDFLLKAGLPTCANGTFLSYNGSALTCEAVTGGSTGTVTAVSGNSPISVATGTTTPSISISQASSTTNGYLSSTDWNTFNNKLSVSATAPTGAGQILRYDGTAYGPAFLGLADIRASITPYGGAFTNAACNSGQSLYWQSSTDTFQCQSISINDSQVAYSTSRNANTFLAAPDGAAGTPTFRTIASSDLPSGTLSGSGTTGYLPYYSAASTLANSPLLTNGGNVGIGTTTPLFPLEVTRNAPGTISAVGTTVTGVGTTFLSTFSVGDTIYCYGQARTVVTVDSDTSLTITSAFNPVPTGLAYTRSAAKFTGTVEIEGNGPSANGGISGPLDLLVLKNTYTTHGWSVGSAIKFEGQNGIFAGRIGTSWNGGLNYGDMFIQTTGANPAMWIGYTGNIAIGTTAASAKFTTLASGARTSGITAVSFSNTSTSATASINKIGLNIQSTGNWSGTGAVNTALVVNATGGTTNYAATFDGGNVGISNSTPGTLLHVGSASVAAGTAVAQFETATGICTLTPATSGSGIACSSDETLKENIENVSGHFALEKILSIQAVTYNFKKDPRQNKKTGYIAQQIKQVAPEFVRQNNDGLYQIYYDGFVPWITEAIKELNLKIGKLVDDSETKNLELEKKIQNLERRASLLEAQNLKMKRQNTQLQDRLERLEQIIKK